MKPTPPLSSLSLAPIFAAGALALTPLKTHVCHVPHDAAGRSSLRVGVRCLTLWDGPRAKAGRRRWSRARRLRHPSPPRGKEYNNANPDDAGRMQLTPTLLPAAPTILTCRQLPPRVVSSTIVAASQECLVHRTADTSTVFITWTHQMISRSKMGETTLVFGGST